MTGASRLICTILLLMLHIELARADEVGGNADSLRTEIAQLEARISALENDEARTTLDAARHAELCRVVLDVLADAAERSAMFDHAIHAGHDGRFFVASADGNFRLAIAGQQQIRFIYNRQSEGPEDDHRSGFELRRTQLKFEGHVLDSRLSYKVQGAFNRAGGAFTLLDAEIAWDLAEGWSIRIGQFRPRFLREDSTSSTRQLAVERSLVNSRFAQNRTEGVEMRAYAGERIRWSIAYNDGISSTTGFAGRGANTPALSRTTEFAFMGRAEARLAGNWRQFREFTSWSDEPFGLLIGSSLHWQRDEYGTPDSVTEVIRWSVDASAKFGGAGAFVAFVGNHEGTKGDGSVDQFGLIVQGSAFIVPDAWEAFVRYEWGDADGMGKDLSYITVGVNRYIAKHALKWTTDVGIGLNEVAAFWAAGSAGVRADAPGENGQVVVRTQVQVLF
jgi:hypothetical protein